MFRVLIACLMLTSCSPEPVNRTSNKAEGEAILRLAFDQPDHTPDTEYSVCSEALIPRGTADEKGCTRVQVVTGEGTTLHATVPNTYQGLTAYVRACRKGKCADSTPIRLDK